MNMHKQIAGILGAVLGIVGAASAAQNFVHEQGTVPYLNSGSAITAGSLVDLGDRYGVALADIASNTTGTVAVDGLWKFARTDTNAISQGAVLSWSSATAVTNAAVADKYVGVAVTACAVTTTITNSLGETSAFVIVDLNAWQRQAIVGTDVQAWDTDLDKLAKNNAASLTNGAPATFFPGYGVIVVTNHGIGQTNIMTTIGTVSYP